MYLELIFRDDMYVYDLVSGGECLQEVKKMDSDSIELLAIGGFQFHKLYSNKPNLETNYLSSQTELISRKNISEKSK